MAPSGLMRGPPGAGTLDTHGHILDTATDSDSRLRRWACRAVRICLLCLHAKRSPFIRHHHEVSFHSCLEAIPIIWWLNNCWFGLTCNHSHRFSHALHFLNYIILPHIIYDAYDKLVIFFIHANKNRIIDHIYE